MPASTQAGTAYVRFRGDFSQLERQVRTLGTSFTRSGRGPQQFANNLNKLERETRTLATDTRRLSDAQRRQGSAFRSASGPMGTYTKNAQKATQATKNLERSATPLASKLRGVGKAAVGAAAAYIGLGAAKDAVDSTIDLAKASLSLNKNLGFTAKTASGLSAVLLARGADARSVGMAFTTFAGQVRQARSGSEDAVKNFNNLGVSMKELRKASPEDVFFQVSDGLGKLGEGFARTDLQRKLFGRGYQTLGPLIRQGSAAVREQIDDAAHLGATFNKLGLKDMEDVIAAQRRFKVAQLGLKVGFTQLVTPAIEAASDKMAEFSKIIRDPHLSAQEKLDALAAEFSHFVTTAAEQFTRQAPRVAAAFVKGFIAAPIWAQVLTGGLLLARFGGLAAFTAIGRTMGAALGLGVGTGMATTVAGESAFVRVLGGAGAAGAAGGAGGILGGAFASTFILAAAAGLLTFELGKTLVTAFKGHPLQAPVSEEITHQLNEALGGIAKRVTIGRAGVTLRTKIGDLIFDPQTGVVIKARGKKLQDLVGKTADQVIQSFKQGFGGVGRPGGTVDLYGKALDQLQGLTRLKLGKLPGITKVEIESVRKAVRQGLDWRQAINQLFDANVAAIERGIDRGTITVKKGNAAITALLNAQAKALGLSGIHGIESGVGQHAAAAARGGQAGMMVRGVGTGDTVPARLEPGEVVINRKAVQRMGGPRRVNRINQMFPRFQGGGFVTQTGDKIGNLSFAGVAPGVLDDLSARGLNLEVLGARKWLKDHKKKASVIGDGPLTPGLGGWHMIDSLASRWGLSPGTFTGRLGESGSWHGVPDGPGRARATDYSDGYATHGELVFARKMAKRYGGQLLELIHTPLGFGISDGQQVAPYATADHYDHVHVAFQKGGIIGLQKGGFVPSQIRKKGGPYVSTAYGPPWGGIQGTGTTATGINLHGSPHKYLVAVDPGRIPLHTQLGIWPNPFNYRDAFRAEDTGGAIQGNRIDFYDWRGRAKQLGWGRKTVSVAKASLLGKSTKPQPTQPGGTTTPTETAFDIEKLPISKAAKQHFKKSLQRVAELQASTATYADFANRAGGLTTTVGEDEVAGLVGGKDQIAWLQKELGDLFKLRNQLVTAYLILKHAIEVIKTQIAELKDRIAKLGKGPAKAAAKKKRDELRALLPGITGKMGEITTTLDEVQGVPFGMGKYDQLTTLPQAGVLGGSIFDVQSELKSLGEKDTVTDSEGPDQSALIAALQAIADKLAQQLFVSETSLSVLRQTPTAPYVGSFQAGGVVPGVGPKLATVHGGEAIGQPAQPVVVVVQDGAVNANRIRVLAGHQAERMLRQRSGRVPGVPGALQ